jgi:hypothetical protein
MYRLTPAFVLSVWLLSVGTTPLPADAEEYPVYSSEVSRDVAERVGRVPDGARRAYDLLALRPLGLVQVAVGAAVFVAAYPVSVLVNGEDEVRDICITGPVDQTFRRPLGRL